MLRSIPQCPRPIWRGAAALSFATVLGVASAYAGPLSPPPAPEIDDSSASEGIVGGEDAAGLYPATAVLGFEDGGGLSTIFCSAVLIREDVLLTAAHCFGETEPHWAFFGDSPFGTGEAEIVVTDSYLIHPEFDATFSADAIHDLALVFLSEIPSVDPVTEDSRDAEELLDALVTYVGFGVTQGTGEDGTKRAATARVRDLGDDHYLTDPEDGSPCFGDSGGPVYLVGEDEAWPTLVGITSFVLGSDCVSGGAGAVRLDVHAEWILAEAGPPWTDATGDDDGSLGGDDDDGPGIGTGGNYDPDAETVSFGEIYGEEEAGCACTSSLTPSVEFREAGLWAFVLVLLSASRRRLGLRPAR